MQFSSGKLLSDVTKWLLIGLLLVAAILVFMLAGSATNIATMRMIRQEMGTSVLAAYLFSLFTASISIGYLASLMIRNLLRR